MFVNLIFVSLFHIGKKKKKNTKHERTHSYNHRLTKRVLWNAETETHSLSIFSQIQNLSDLRFGSSSGNPNPPIGSDRPTFSPELHPSRTQSWIPSLPERVSGKASDSFCYQINFTSNFCLRKSKINLKLIVIRDDFSWKSRFIVIVCCWNLNCLVLDS